MPDACSLQPPQHFAITTAIDYVNAAPHLGHAYEKIATDVIARFYRLWGCPNVFFLTGTDEHGTKVEKTAHEKGVSPQAYVDSLAAQFKDTWDKLGLTYDRFIRTSEPDHKRFVTAVWNKLVANGDIEKRAYTGRYCTGCECFLNERDLTLDGLCALHQRAPENVIEENYFFALSKYKERLHDLIANTPFVQPEFRVKEVLHMLDELTDISVSRPVSSVSWGIPVPGDDDPQTGQVIYVWIDALSNYVTGTHGGQTLPGNEPSSPQPTQWPVDTHMIGKDILRFHAIYWPAILMAAELPLPKQVYAHGFININDTKISKSLGNVLSVWDVADRFSLDNTDPIRYYLLAASRFGHDGNFTEDEFKRVVNADLANNLGNLLNRTVSMCQKYTQGLVPQPPEPRDAFSGLNDILEAYQAYDFQRAITLILAKVDEQNQAIHYKEPWTLYKTQQTEALHAVLFEVLDTLRQVALLFWPIIPTLSQTIWTQLGMPVSLLDTVADIQHGTLTLTDELNTPIVAGQALCPGGPILPRLDDDLVGASAKHK